MLGGSLGLVLFLMLSVTHAWGITGTCIFFVMLTVTHASVSPQPKTNLNLTYPLLQPVASAASEWPHLKENHPGNTMVPLSASWHPLFRFWKVTFPGKSVPT